MAYKKGKKKTGGNKKGSKHKWTFSEFQKEFDADCKKHKGSIYKFLYERARVSDTVLIALGKKLLPDLKQVDVLALLTDTADDSKEAKAIRKKLLARFNRGKRSNG